MRFKPYDISGFFQRWIDDLRSLTRGMIHDPLAHTTTPSWHRDFAGDITKYDTWYAFFLVLLSLIPAAIAAYVLPEPQWHAMARLFGSPLQTVISGIITSALIFMGTHLNHCGRSFSQVFKLMLRIMAIHPILSFLAVLRWGPIAALLFHGIFVIRGVRKTYPIPFMNAVLFFGLVYAVFALFQLQGMVSPPPTPPLPAQFSAWN